MNNNISKSEKSLNYLYSAKADTGNMPLQGHILPSSLSCKSQESLDSGIFFRHKSNESIDSLGLNGNSKTNQSTEADFSSADEVIPPLPIHQYEDYIRECQDIQQSIIIRNKEEGKTQLSRSNSLDEQDDDMAAEWLQMAGLSDLVTDPSLNRPGNSVPRESLSSMTVLLTLTRPQREAVLRRITSFKRSHMNKKPAKPALRSVFPDLQFSPDPDAAEKDVFEFESPPSKSPTVNEVQEKSPNRVSNEFAELTPFTRPRASSSPFKFNSKSSESFDFPTTKRSIDASISSKSVEASIEVTVASTESLPAISSVKLADDVLPGHAVPSTRSSYLYPDQQQAVSSAVSMPDLNLQGRYSESTSSNSIPKARKSESDVVDPPSEQSKPPPVKMRENPVGSDRKKKALSDIPSIQAISSATMADDPARLVLETEAGEKKSSAPRRKSSKDMKSLGGKSPMFTFTSKKSEVSPRSLMKQNNIPVTSSPELKKRFLLSPGLTLSVKRRSPTNSPMRAHRLSAAVSPPQSPNRIQKKQSPLRKFSSMSIPTLRSTPKRSGSYKIKQSTNSPRKSLRRSRSLKLRDKPPISLASMKKTAERKRSSPLPRKTPSIETLSISPKSEKSSWKSSKDNVSLQSTEESRSKGMSFSAEAASNDSSLPNFSLVRDRLGITKINDLSWVDMRKVQSLALIELTALFDLRGIELKRRKVGKNKPKEPSVFGTPLSTLVDWDKKRIQSEEKLMVPMVLSEILSFLEKNGLKTEGILRKCGSTARMKLLKQDMDVRFGSNPGTGLPPCYDSKAWMDAHPHDVATLLKQFLRELPTPLLSFEYIDAFQSCRLITDRKEQLQALNLLIILLNDVNRDCLKLILKFLSHIVANENHNKMSLNNVAMITAPNLFITARKSKKELKLSAGSQDLKLAAGTSNIVRMLIKYHKLLWVVPAFMLSQVRHMNKAELGSKKNSHQSKDKLKMKLFQSTKVKGSKATPFVQQVYQPFDGETPKSLIRVQAPNMNLTSIAVQLTNQLTAGDVIAKYRRHNERMRQSSSENNDQNSTSNYTLYEVGGNIHERCLDASTNIAAILQVNPEASWFIKSKPSA